MTEFKKLNTLVFGLRTDIDALFSSRVEGTINDLRGGGNSFSCQPDVPLVNPEELFQLSCQVREHLLDGCSRIRKIVSKAREADPNRQIYNEAMCKRIEELLTDFCTVLLLLQQTEGNPSEPRDSEQSEDEPNFRDAFMMNDFSEHQFLEEAPILIAIDDAHDRYILRRAQEEEWNSRVAQGVSDVLCFEAQNRSLLGAEEKCTRSLLVEAKRVDKNCVISLLEERAEARWKEELHRRSMEDSKLRSNLEHIQILENIPTFIGQHISDSTARSVFAGYMRSLVSALLRTPEDVNIRRLRNNNQYLIHDYGHPCLTRSSCDSCQNCQCSGVVHAAETLWYRMGYSIQYTRAKVSTVEELLLNGSIPDLALPCGFLLSSHTYVPLGFEEYSERYFELKEPDAMEHASEWMDWFSMMQRMEQTLASI